MYGAGIVGAHGYDYSVDIRTELDRLKTQFASDDLPQLHSGIVVPQQHQPYFSGSLVPAVGADSFVVGSSGLVLPRGSEPSPMDYIGTYITATEYLETELPDEVTALLLIDIMLKQQPLIELLQDLVGFGRLLFRPLHMESLAANFGSCLTLEARSRLTALLRSSQEGKRHLLARQPLLHAMRLVLTTVESNENERKYPPGVAAMLLTHAVAVLLGRDAEEASGQIAGMDESLVMELVRNGVLNQSQDTFALLDRHWRLWTKYDDRARIYPPRLPLKELFREATGLCFEDGQALGLALLANAQVWEPGKPLFVDPNFSTRIASSTKEEFFRLISRSQEDFAMSLKGWQSHWDFLEFEKFPVARLPQGLLVLDEQFLLERITDGLYWFIFDYERNSFGPQAMTNWTQTYGELVELLVEDSVADMAPPELTGGSNYYTEEDIGQAYPGKVCDAAVHFGSVLVMFEVVSGRLQTKTRIGGSVEHFRTDTEKLVVKKARQLDEASTSFLENQVALAGFENPSVRVVPVVVVGSGYPLNPSTAAFVDELLKSEDLLSDARVMPLCLIDLEEVEMLEGMRERGISPPDLLMGWKRSPLAALPLKNYVLSSLSGTNASGRERPRRMKSAVDDVFRSLLSRLGVQPVRKPSWPRKLRRMSVGGQKFQ